MVANSQKFLNNTKEILKKKKYSNHENPKTIVHDIYF